MHTVHGTFQLRRGAIRFDPASGQASGEIVIDLASGQSGNKWRDEMIKRGVARYNWTTGKWEWGEPPKESRY